MKSANNIFKHLMSDRELTDVNDHKTPEIQGEIEFRNVNFTYPARPDALVLNNVSFKVPRGKTCAFVGSSGSGKSTIISLLERFYFPSAGEILVDGIKLNDIDVNHFRQHVALVAQEPKLFNLSIRENITYGLDPARVTHATVEDAANKANAAKFIEELPAKYDTGVGEWGNQLSGGQVRNVAGRLGYSSSKKQMDVCSLKPMTKVQSAGPRGLSIHTGSEWRNRVNPRLKLVLFLFAPSA